MSAEGSPEASVVVPVRDDHRVLRLLASLAEQTVPAHRYEIIVVENGSRALTEAVGALEANVRYLHLEHPNPAAARNAGLCAARGRFLLLTDADCVARADWIERMVERLQAGDLAAAGGTIEKYRPRSAAQHHGITVVDGQHSLNYLPALPLPYVVSANAGYVTDVLRGIGGFDEAFVSGSDVDVCYRLGLAGHAVGLAPQAAVMHEDRSTVRAHFHRFRVYAIYQVRLFAKYRPISGRRFVLNPYPLARLGQALAAAPTALAHLAGGDHAPAARLLLQVVEAAGVWCGDITGSLKYRQLYV